MAAFPICNYFPVLLLAGDGTLSEYLVFCVILGSRADGLPSYHTVGHCYPGVTILVPCPPKYFWKSQVINPPPQ